MFDARYVEQIRLLLRCLPEVAGQDCFALKGGTAINLFVRDMPRISVDIDLVYLPLKPRDEALKEMSEALLTIQRDLQSRMDDCVVIETRLGEIVTKLNVQHRQVAIAIEPNMVFRGAVFAPQSRELAAVAQRRFELTASIATLNVADLYGGKLCAALDRQHPRDLFDVKLLLDGDGISPAIRRAFVVYLAGHPRPMSELLIPNTKDIAAMYRSQFEGMTSEPTSLEDLIEVQHRLPVEIRNALDDDEKAFLLSIKRGEPEWERLGLYHIKDLPALQWKVMNVRKMDRVKREQALGRLSRVFQDQA